MPYPKQIAICLNVLMCIRRVVLNRSPKLITELSRSFWGNVALFTLFYCVCPHHAAPTMKEYQGLQDSF